MSFSSEHIDAGLALVDEPAADSRLQRDRLLGYPERRLAEVRAAR